MEKLENALKTFNLDANFTHEQLEKAYSLKSKIMYVDFGNKKEDTIRREQDSYDYQILIMYEYLRKMFKDIDLEKRTISINKSYQRLDGRDIITLPKTPKSKRIVTIPPFLAEELREYISHLYGIMADERMFHFTKSYMEHEIIRGIKASGVKRIRLHDLRHSHASLLVELGFTPLAIAERLGHEKIETTLNTYSHLYPNKQGELADKLEIENNKEGENERSS